MKIPIKGVIYFIKIQFKWINSLLKKEALLLVKTL